MTDIEKNMNEAMEELRKYLDTVGKDLECETTLRPFFALPFIEDPHAEPYLSKIFEEKWLDELTRNLQLFMSQHKESFVTQRSKNNWNNKDSKDVHSHDGCNTTSSKDKTLVHDNKPIIPNDRNIPPFVESNEIGEQYFAPEDIKRKEKTRSTQTQISSIISTSLLEDPHSSFHVINEESLSQYPEELALVKSHLCTTHSNYEKLKLRFHKLHADYHKLVNVAGELTTALENSVQGQTVDLQATLETCIKIFPDLFNHNIRESSQGTSALQLSKSNADIHGTQQLNPDVTHISPKLLNFKKIKMHLINGNIKIKLFLLQALRRKITLGQPSERDEAIHEYISKDLLGLHGQIASDNGKSILPYLLTPGNTIMPHPLQQSAARLLNALSSFRCGRDYLSSGAITINVILKCLSNASNNEIDAFTCNMLIATLQKLSVRKHQRVHMIENGLVEWLIHHLHTECHVMGPYRLEYATALLMNLSLHRVAQKRASGMASFLISTLLTLLSIDHASALPYINGALNNFLSNRVINEEAKKMKLSHILEHYRNYKTGEIRRHLDHILKIHRGESTINIEDQETVDDDNEKFDVIENELEDNDPVKHYPGELCGEALLATCYVISANSIPDRNAKQELPTFRYSRISSTSVRSNDRDSLTDVLNRESEAYNRNLLLRESSKIPQSSSVELTLTGTRESGLVDEGKLSSIASLAFNNTDKDYVNNTALKQNIDISTEEAFMAKPKLLRTPP